MFYCCLLLSFRHVLLIACDIVFFYYINLVDCDKIALNHIHSKIIFIDVIK